jgi:RNA recognition motif-containing protein
LYVTVCMLQFLYIIIACMCGAMFCFVLFCRVTILKDRETRQSKGVAFVLYLDRESAQNAVRALHKTQVSLITENRLMTSCS